MMLIVTIFIIQQINGMVGKDKKCNIIKDKIIIKPFKIKIYIIIFSLINNLKLILYFSLLFIIIIPSISLSYIILQINIL